VKRALRAKLGRPPVLVGDLLDQLCALLAAGHDVVAAAAAMKVTRATVYNTVNRAETPDDPGGRIAAALTAGRTARREARHGTESCYTHLGCRRPECAAAATQARQARRETAAQPPAPPIPLTPPGDHTTATAAALYAALATPLADAS
jgi:hypothetical protein